MNGGKGMNEEEAREYRAKMKQTRDTIRQKRAKRRNNIETKMYAFKTQRLEFQQKQLKNTPLGKLGFTKRRFTDTMEKRNLNDNMTDVDTGGAAASKQVDGVDTGIDYYIARPLDPLDNAPPPTQRPIYDHGNVFQPRPPIAVPPPVVLIQKPQYDYTDMTDKYVQAKQNAKVMEAPSGVGVSQFLSQDSPLHDFQLPAWCLKGIAYLFHSQGESYLAYTYKKDNKGAVPPLLKEFYGRTKIKSEEIVQLSQAICNTYGPLMLLKDGLDVSEEDPVPTLNILACMLSKYRLIKVARVAVVLPMLRVKCLWHFLEQRLRI